MPTNYIKIFDDTVIKLSVNQGLEEQRATETLGSFTTGELAFTRDSGRLFVGDNTDDEPEHVGLQETVGGILVGNKYLGLIDSKPLVTFEHNGRALNYVGQTTATGTGDGKNMVEEGLLTDKSKFRLHSQPGAVEIWNNWDRTATYNPKYHAYNGDYMFDIYENALILFDNRISADPTSSTQPQIKKDASGMPVTPETFIVDGKEIPSTSTDALKLTRRTFVQNWSKENDQETESSKIYGDGYVMLRVIEPDNQTVRFKPRSFQNNGLPETDNNYNHNILEVFNVPVGSLMQNFSDDFFIDDDLVWLTKDLKYVKSITGDGGMLKLPGTIGWSTPYAGGRGATAYMEWHFNAPTGITVPSDDSYRLQFVPTVTKMDNGNEYIHFEATLLPEEKFDLLQPPYYIKLERGIESKGDDPHLLIIDEKCTGSDTSKYPTLFLNLDPLIEHFSDDFYIDQQSMKWEDFIVYLNPNMKDIISITGKNDTLKLPPNVSWAYPNMPEHRGAKSYMEWHFNEPTGITLPTDEVYLWKLVPTEKKNDEGQAYLHFEGEIKKEEYFVKLVGGLESTYSQKYLLEIDHKATGDDANTYPSIVMTTVGLMTHFGDDFYIGGDDLIWLTKDLKNIISITSPGNSLKVPDTLAWSNPDASDMRGATAYVSVKFINPGVTIPINENDYYQFKLTPKKKLTDNGKEYLNFEAQFLKDEYFIKLDGGLESTYSSKNLIEIDRKATGTNTATYPTLKLTTVGIFGHFSDDFFMQDDKIWLTKDLKNIISITSPGNILKVPNTLAFSNPDSDMRGATTYMEWKFNKLDITLPTTKTYVPSLKPTVEKTDNGQKYIHYEITLEDETLIHPPYHVTLKGGLTSNNSDPTVLVIDKNSTGTNAATWPVLTMSTEAIMSHFSDDFFVYQDLIYLTKDLKNITSITSPNNFLRVPETLAFSTPDSDMRGAKSFVSVKFLNPGLTLPINANDDYLFKLVPTKKANDNGQDYLNFEARIEKEEFFIKLAGGLESSYSSKNILEIDKKATGTNDTSYPTLTMSTSGIFGHFSDDFFLQSDKIWLTKDLKNITSITSPSNTLKLPSTIAWSNPDSDMRGATTYMEWKFNKFTGSYVANKTYHPQLKATNQVTTGVVHYELTLVEDPEPPVNDSAHNNPHNNSGEYDILYTDNLGFTKDGLLKYVDDFEPSYYNAAKAKIDKFQERNTTINYLKTPVTIAQSNTLTWLYGNLPNFSTNNKWFNANNPRLTVSTTTIGKSVDKLVGLTSAVNTMVAAFNSGSAHTSYAPTWANQVLTVPNDTTNTSGVGIAVTSPQIGTPGESKSFILKGQVSGVNSLSTSKKITIFLALVNNNKIIAKREVTGYCNNLSFEMDLEMDAVTVTGTTYFVWGLICDNVGSSITCTITDQLYTYRALNSEHVFEVSNEAATAYLDYQIDPYLYCSRKVMSSPLMLPIVSANNTPFTPNASYYSLITHSDSYVKTWNNLFYVLGCNHFANRGQSTPAVPRNLGSQSVFGSFSEGNKVGPITVDETISSGAQVFIPSTARTVILQISHNTTENNTIAIFYANNFDELGVVLPGLPTKQYNHPTAFTNDIILNPSYDQQFGEPSINIGSSTSWHLNLGGPITSGFHSLTASVADNQKKLPDIFCPAAHETCIMMTSASETRILEVPLHKAPSGGKRHFCLRVAGIRPSSTEVLNQLVIRVLGYRV